jgi:hypothetical protein
MGIPLPLPAGKSASEAYPCVNHHCGCHSAEECWRHCCCMSLMDKLVWARENHVTPPDYVLADARYHGIQWDQFCADDHDDELALCPCCPCGEHNDSCCFDDLHNHDSTAKQASHDDGIILIEAIKCRGTDQNWNGLSISLAPPAISQTAVTENTSDSICIISLRYASLSWRPPIPPPRVVTV